MKNILLILFLSLNTLLISDELSWVNQQVNAIKPPRTGMKYRDIKSIKNPFIFLKKNRTSEPKIAKSRSIKRVPQSRTTKVAKNKIIRTANNRRLVLGAILNNSVMINEEWYKLGDKVNGYEISQINRNSVLLRKQKRQLILSTKSTSNKLKFLNK